jgi:flagellar basal-body rod protein FlgC
MDYSASFAISATGMALERMRVDVAAMNLANANTVQGADGAIYRPMRVIAQAVDAVPAFNTMIDQGMAQALQLPAPPMVTIEPAQNNPRMVYEPGNPMANERGFVAYAGVDSATEMVTLMSATRAYEANVAAMNTSRTLALRALEIGGSN